jgi:hypothetical protein
MGRLGRGAHACQRFAQQSRAVHTHTLQGKAEAATGSGWRRDAQLHCVVRTCLSKLSWRGETAPRRPCDEKVRSTQRSAGGLCTREGSYAAA